MDLCQKEWNIFKTFCEQHGYCSLPASSITIEQFMIHHVNSRAMSTLLHALSAISHFQAKSHFESPTVSKSVTRAFEGAKRSFGRPSVSVNIFTHDHLSLLSNLALVLHVLL